MTPSQIDTSGIAKDDARFNQMGAFLVATLCFDALKLAESSERIRTCVEAFKESRSAWDATELANALYAWEPGHPAVSALVETIDREATQTAGFELPNKIRRQR